ncbi:hypothetical protein [Streptomyces swartbergensis]|uniref:Uncharacterized protein n=1 Tax=Streptomyces swartbergensis TaxID=487165 RepID=A0A243SBU2_9ACTN|nr:hypothetical protein [Streptomyces swartbergensis]OUD04510.1 hypothetical protein CA983_03905 [Streptomyces swartbergensis]
MPTCLAVCTTVISADPPGTSLPDQRHRSTVIYEDIVRPACEQLGLDFLRADRLTDAGLPRDQLLRMLTEVDFVVADLGGSDGDLSFGLGMRHALGRPTVHVTERADELRAAGPVTCVPFPPHDGDPVAARQRLTELLAAEKGTPRESGPPSSPVPSLLQPPRQSTADDMKEGPGFFDLIVDAEAHVEALAADMADVEAAMEELKEVTALILADADRTSRPGAPPSTPMAVLNRLAKAIDGPANELGAATERLAEHLEAGVGALRGFLEWIAGMPRPDWPDGAKDLLDQMVSAHWEAESSAASYQEGIALVGMLGSASRTLRRPTRRIIASFRKLFQILAVLEELQRTAAALKES